MAVDSIISARCSVSSMFYSAFLAVYPASKLGVTKDSGAVMRGVMSVATC